ncbi:MAG: DUF2946 family protein [Sphingobium sp.]
MTRVIRQSDNARGVLSLLALLVLVIQLVAPSGFMPMRTEQGVVVTLCTGSGAVDVVMQRGQAPGAKKQDGTALGLHQPCAYAAAAQPMVPPLALADLSLPVWILSSGTIAWALRTGVIARLAAPPPPSSGPPATV